MAIDPLISRAPRLWRDCDLEARSLEKHAVLLLLQAIRLLKYSVGAIKLSLSAVALCYNPAVPHYSFSQLHSLANVRLS